MKVKLYHRIRKSLVRTSLKWLLHLRYFILVQRRTNFLKIDAPTQNSGLQKSDEKPFQYWGPTSIRRDCTEFVVLWISGFYASSSSTKTLSSHPCYKNSPSYLSWFYGPNYIWRRMQCMQQLSPAPCYCPTLISKYSPQHPTLKNSQYRPWETEVPRSYRTAGS